MENETNCLTPDETYKELRGLKADVAYLDEVWSDPSKVAEELNLKTMEELDGYDPEQLDAEAFKKRYAGMYQKDDGKRLSKSSMRSIWRRFLTRERVDFFNAHKNLTLYDIARIGIDKFIVTMGWRKVSQVARWRNNKVRVGICAHCQDQFLPMMFQTNYGLCNNCRPLYSAKAIRNFILKQLHTSDRYQGAHRDAMMDFFIMFYSDFKLRTLFLKENDFAKEYEAMQLEIPAEVAAQMQAPVIDVEGAVIDERDAGQADD